jgi:3-hydroxyacyl-[acyl-carrier-protein] dehydratase
MQKQGIYKFDCTVHVEQQLAVSAQIMIARQEK